MRIEDRQIGLQLLKQLTLQELTDLGRSRPNLRDEEVVGSRSNLTILIMSDFETAEELMRNRLIKKRHLEALCHSLGLNIHAANKGILIDRVVQN